MNTEKICVYAVLEAFLNSVCLWGLATVLGGISWAFLISSTPISLFMYLDSWSPCASQLIISSVLYLGFSPPAPRNTPIPTVKTDFEFHGRSSESGESQTRK